MGAKRKRRQADTHSNVINFKTFQKQQNVKIIPRNKSQVTNKFQGTRNKPCLPAGRKSRLYPNLDSSKPQASNAHQAVCKSCYCSGSSEK